MNTKGIIVLIIITVVMGLGIYSMVKHYDNLEPATNYQQPTIY